MAKAIVEQFVSNQVIVPHWKFKMLQIKQRFSKSLVQIYIDCLSSGK